MSIFKGKPENGQVQHSTLSESLGGGSAHDIVTPYDYTEVGAYLSTGDICIYILAPYEAYISSGRC